MTRRRVSIVSFGFAGFSFALLIAAKVLPDGYTGSILLNVAQGIFVGVLAVVCTQVGVAAGRMLWKAKEKE